MPEPIITINQLNKIYHTEQGNEIKAIENFNFDINVNNFVCIVGPSGCGKSTLLRIIAGLDSASSGFVSYQGQAICKPSRDIGMVFQEYSLLPWQTVINNVALGLEFAKQFKQKRMEVAVSYLKMVGLEDYARAYPFELSGGMQQRVAIARALANNPQVLLMDEPFGALDAHTRILMQKELLTIWGENMKTIVFVTHSVDEAIYLADTVIVMSSRPGGVKEVINVNMSRPRDRANPIYGQLSSQILLMLEEEVAKAK